ncbi:MAG TPA: methyltransferase domain-containing protein [Solirubrobacteraceae bacterium]|nr:methyltransferase domain-containing protein [Solirubrobacteraceae bacterium]
MDLDPTKIAALDATLVEYTEDLRRAGEEDSAVTLAYTLGVDRAWRQVVRMLPVPAGGSVLDVGTGFGILPFELAASSALRAVGIDHKAEYIEHAATLKSELAALELFEDGAEIDLLTGDARDLQFADESFDLVFMREVLQFIPEPVVALAELYRVLRPGGFACVGDTDDQLWITWPPPSPALSRLVDAVASVQRAQGGDRQTGRKLTSHLRAAGFKINSLVVLPEAQHRVVEADDGERALIIEQLRAARPRVSAEGLADVRSFDADLEELESEEPFEQFRLNAKIIVLAERPPQT